MTSLQTCACFLHFHERFFGSVWSHYLEIRDTACCVYVFLCAVCSTLFSNLYWQQLYPLTLPLLSNWKPWPKAAFSSSWLAPVSHWRQVSDAPRSLRLRGVPARRPAPNITLHNPVNTPAALWKKKKAQLSLNAPRTAEDRHSFPLPLAEVKATEEKSAVVCLGENVRAGSQWADKSVSWWDSLLAGRAVS